MASRFSDPSWWPTPPPQKAPSATRIVLGSVLPVVAFVGVAAAIWIGGSGHGTTPAATTATPPAPRTAAGAASRESFAECVRALGGSRGSRFGGRFGSGPSEQFREGVAVCRSLLRPSAAPPAPPPTGTAAAPVA
jgi:hypothetical protein